MGSNTLGQRVTDLDRRVGRVEQILPTLATKADVEVAIEAAVEPLATRAELHAAIAELRGAIAESEERTRTHFDVVTESLRDDIRLIAEGFAALRERLG